jgi:hypothetical protein
MSNDAFATSHFPQNPTQFFLPGGRVLSWREYILRDADKPNLMGGWEKDNGWSPQSVQPYSRDIGISGKAVQEEPNVRFAFTMVCPHWDGERLGVGKSYLPFIEIQGRGGKNQEQRPFHSDGYNYWIDIPRAELGTPGQPVKLIYMQKLDNEDARGLTVEAYQRWKDAPKGKSWQWMILAVWNLV